MGKGFIIILALGFASSLCKNTIGSNSAAQQGSQRETDSSRGRASHRVNGEGDWHQCKQSNASEK